MRLIDADAFVQFLKDAVIIQKYKNLKIDELLTVADVIGAIISDLDGTSLDGFNNAPTIDLCCEECEAINKTRLIIPQHKKGKWIPVTERLPEDGTWNIFSDGKNISVERYKMDAIDHFFPQGRWFSFDKAIAWMPLPPVYREEGDPE